MGCCVRKRKAELLFRQDRPLLTVFFIDRSLGVEPIKTELINSGLVIEIHDDHFARDEEDRVWLKTVGERGWVVLTVAGSCSRWLGRLTKDQRMRYRPLEISAPRASNARVFVLTAGNLRGSEIAAVFLAALPRIYGILRSQPGPFVARVSQSGHVAIT